MFLKPMPRLKIPFGTVRTKYCNSVLRGAGEEGLFPSNVSSPTSEIIRGCPQPSAALSDDFRPRFPKYFCLYLTQISLKKNV